MAVHSHARAATSGRLPLLAALVLTLMMMAAEIVAGIMSGSLSLLADAAHMLTDASALALSLFAAWMASRPATPEKTYGYYRTEILAALANGILLWLLVVWIGVNALERLLAPVSVKPAPMLAVAAAGLAVNLLSGWILYTGSRDNLNVRVAWFHVMADALGSVGVIIAAIVIHFTGWLHADALAGIVIATLIMVSSWGLIRQSVNVLLEATPHHLSADEVERAMLSVESVREVHDLHLWTITTGLEALSAHVIVDDVSRSVEILKQLNGVLEERFRITHTTLQLEPRARDS